MKKIICVLLITALMAGCSSLGGGLNSDTAISSDTSNSGIANNITHPEQESSSKIKTEDELLLKTTIEIDDTNYVEYIVTISEEKLNSVATCYFDGSNLEKEFATIGVLSVLNEKLDIDDYGIFVTSGEDIGLYAFMDGKLLSKTGVEKYDDMDIETISTEYFEELGNLMSEQVAKAAKEANLANK